LSTRPLAANAVTSALVQSLAEVIRQLLQEKAPKVPSLVHQMIIGSCVVAPLSTVWFSFLEARFASWPPGNLGTVLAKTACGQTFFAPTINTCFMGSQGLLEGRRPADVFRSICEKFWTVQRKNMAVWIPANLFAYKFVPPRFRVLFSNFVALFWTLSLILTTSKNKTERQNGTASTAALATK
ncbi:sym-1, partial [Symbiodinium sp. CCMP2456]